MKIMERPLCGLVILILLFSCSVCQAERNDDDYSSLIVGKWVSKKKSEGGLGGVYIFDNKENVNIIYGAIIDYKYELDGDKIIETYPDGTSKISDCFVEGSTLIKDQVYPKNCAPECKLKMKKLVNDIGNKQTILGKWAYQDKKGAWMILEYAADGKAQLCIPLALEKGKYNLINNELNMEVKGEHISRKIRIEKNCLVLLPDENHSEEVYVR